MRHFSFRPALTLRGRAFRGIRGWAGKPTHPPLTDVPIGAYTVAVGLDVVSFLFRSMSWAPDLHKAAGFTFLGGAVVSLVTALTGLFDWLDTQKGTQIRRTANAHAWTMITMTVLALFNLAFRYFISSESTTGLLLLIVDIGILILAILGGTIGGTMVFDYGFNVETSTDHPVWHPSEVDVIHRKEQPSESET